MNVERGVSPDPLASTRPLADLSASDGAVLVYGTGSAAHRVVAAVLGEGRRVLAIVDDAAGVPVEMMGLPVYSTTKAASAFGSDTPLLLGVFNRAASPYRIAEHAWAAGFSTVVPYSRLVHRISGLQGEYCLDDIQAARHTAVTACARELLGDRRSQELWDSNFALRSTGEYSRALEPDEGDQYAGRGVPGWRPPRGGFLDGGAFDGDVVRNLIGSGWVPGRVYAFEPELETFGRLARTLVECRSLGVDSVAWPCALSNVAGFCRFRSGLGEASRIDADGPDTILAVRGDDALAGVGVSLLKLDVEGAERSALEGLQRTIARSRPFMAIAAYHRTTDLWVLPTYVRSLELGYEFFLRSHGHNGMDLVLYCVPERG